MSFVEDTKGVIKHKRSQNSYPTLKHVNIEAEWEMEEERKLDD